MQVFEGRKAREGRVDWEEGCLARGYGLLPYHKKRLQTCVLLCSFPLLCSTFSYVVGNLVTASATHRSL